MRRSAAGFTLVELMVVLTILAIVAAVALTGFRTNPTGDDARQLASMMSTAYRTAVGGGPVRDDVVAKWLATNPEVKARARFDLTLTDDGVVQATVYRLVEKVGVDDYDWVAVESAFLHREVTAYRVMDSAQIGLATGTVDPGGVPATKYYYPNGTADGFTIYLRHVTRDNAQRYRVVGMPLSPAPQVFPDW